MKKSRILAFCMLLATATGCSTTSGSLDRRPIFNETKFVALSQDLKPGKSIGHIETSVCNKSIFLIPIATDVATMDNALKTLHAQTGARYITNAHSNFTDSSMPFYKKKCFELEGEGFK